MSQETPLTPPISPGPNGHQPDISSIIYTPQPAADVSIGSVLEGPAGTSQTQGPSKSTPSASQVQCHRCQSNPPSEKGRVLILCFDGTGNKFGENSNIVRLFRALKKDSQKRQLLYYQPGVGTYNKRAFITRTASMISSTVDFALAMHLSDHVKDGYKFLIQNYKRGDKICLFGFSRGAHTARVVAGMVYKVGVLPRENLQQVDFAFNIYMTTGYQGYKLSREFKLTFARHVPIDFVGVWDTVSSVGLIPRTHPYTSINYSVKCFRHALALDERRARFRPNVWGEQTLDREQELDVDLLADWELHRSDTNSWQYTAPDRDHADVKEVWFAGSHSDVGGGSHPTWRSQSLSYIPLRWMIRECILAKTGIQFDLEHLRDDLSFDFDDLEKEMKNKKLTPEDLGEAYLKIEEYAEDSRKRAKEKEPSKLANPNSSVISETHFGSIRRHIHDIFDNIFDQLAMKWWFCWWLLEFIPMLTTYQDSEGNWTHLRMRNVGYGRYIPFYNNKIYVHKTVEDRIDKKYQEKDYRPKARNWEAVVKSPMLEYVS